MTQPLRIFIEGPRWTGMWTEIIADSLERLGHEVAYSYHNHKQTIDRVALLGSYFLPGTDRASAWTQRYRKQLYEQLVQFRPDVIFSIQGKMNAEIIKRLRKNSPHLKTIFWWGDILTDKALKKINNAAEFSDRLLVSYHGIYEKLEPTYSSQLAYFPFGVSEHFHQPENITDKARKRFTADVSFVGTCYTERCKLISYLNSQLDTPVQVWGRGWRHCAGIKSRGSITLQDSQKIHACSKISLNLHHTDTNNGFNMKFYEIPAAGGFQLCDWQTPMDEIELGKIIISCKSLPEFADKIRYYLTHEKVRKQITRATTQSVYTTANYPQKLAELISALD